MLVGFIKPDFTGERRVALLPEHVPQGPNQFVIEKGFGQTMGIEDSAYIERGCTLASRQAIFEECPAIFSLKLIQKSDYSLLRQGQMIVGWTHPFGSGNDFMHAQAIPKNLMVVDLDNIAPKVFVGFTGTLIPWIPSNFVWRNSWIAGYAAVEHALMQFGMVPDSRTKIAVLSAGNVAQGALAALNLHHADVRQFTRKTMHEFKRDLEQWDVVVNGIEVDQPNSHILNKEELSRMRRGALVIDAAADAGNAIEGTRYTTMLDPIYEDGGLFFYVVNNAPSVFYRKASQNISESFSKHVYSLDFARFLDLVGNK